MEDPATVKFSEDFEVVVQAPKRTFVDMDTFKIKYSRAKKHKISTSMCDVQLPGHDVKTPGVMIAWKPHHEGFNGNYTMFARRGTGTSLDLPLETGEQAAGTVHQKAIDELIELEKGNAKMYLTVWTFLTRMISKGRSPTWKKPRGGRRDLIDRNSFSGDLSVTSCKRPAFPAIVDSGSTRVTWGTCSWRVVVLMPGPRWPLPLNRL